MLKFNSKVDVEGFRLKQAEEEKLQQFDQLKRCWEVDKKMKNFEKKKLDEHDLLMAKKHEKNMILKDNKKDNYEAIRKLK